MLKQTDPFFTPVSEEELEALLLTDSDLDRLVLGSSVGIVGASDQPTSDNTSKPRQRHAKRAKRL